MRMRVLVGLILTFALVAGTVAAGDRIHLAQAPEAETAPAVKPDPPPVRPAPRSFIPPPKLPEPPPIGATRAEVPAPAGAVPLPPQAPLITGPVPLPVARPDAADKPPDLGKIPASALFAEKSTPALNLRARAIGYYPKGCLAGAVAMPVNGPTWQVMRLSRNRNWGHPTLVDFLKKFAPRVAKATGWNGVLVGDLSQPRGGPTPYGHKSHQTGLDVDIWFMPMPDRELSRKEREELSAINVVADDWKDINPKFWTPQHVEFIKAAAVAPEVERVLVNAAIKKELCKVVKGDRKWLGKVRPWYGHHDHIHVRLECPDGSNNCRSQPAVSGTEECGKELDHWFADRIVKPKRVFKPAKPLTLADLPSDCKSVLNAE